MGYLYILLFVSLYLNITYANVIPCSRILCMHGGRCLISPISGESYCKCSSKFYGATCEMIKPNPPASHPDPFGNCSYASFCKYVFRDNHCDEICNTEGCLFDGFDCQEKTPVKCPLEKQCLQKYGNGKCNPECNSAECGWDGGDCISEKKELSESLVLTLITDPKDFIEKDIASKLLISLSQLLHASVHYQLDSNGNPMIYEWSSSTGQGSLIEIKSPSDISHSISKRSVDVKKGVKVYLILDVSVCQQLSSLGASMEMDVQITFENQHCFTNAQSAAAMLAVDSTKETFADLNIGLANAAVMPRSRQKSSSFLIYIIFAVIFAIIIVAILINTTSVRPSKRKLVTVRNVFFPPTPEDLSKRQNMRQSQKRRYRNQSDRQSFIGEIAANSAIGDSLAFIEPASKRFREEEPPAQPIQNDRIFTELHQHAASAEPISVTHVQNPRLIPCAKVVDSDGRTCIHWAIESVSDKPDFEVIEDIKKLVSIGCPIDAQDDSGATALHLAVRNGRTEVATFLLGKIDVNIQDDDGRTALFDAVSTKSFEMVRKILQIEDVDVNAVAYTNDTALIKCCRIDENGDMLQIAQILLKHPSIQMDKTGEKASLGYTGRMAVHEAAACNSIQILILLISRGAAVSAHDAHQQTPLFLAVQSNQIEAVKLLINQMRSNIAEINASNDCDETPLQIAMSKGFTEIAELLQNARLQMPMPCAAAMFPPPIEHPTPNKSSYFGSLQMPGFPDLSLQMSEFPDPSLQMPVYPGMQIHPPSIPQSQVEQQPQQEQCQQPQNISVSPLSGDSAYGSPSPNKSSYFDFF